MKPNLCKRQEQGYPAAKSILRTLFTAINTTTTKTGGGGGGGAEQGKCTLPLGVPEPETKGRKKKKTQPEQRDMWESKNKTA